LHNGRFDKAEEAEALIYFTLPSG